MDTERHHRNRKVFIANVKKNLPLALLAAAIICITIIFIALIMGMQIPEQIEILRISEADRIECPGFTDENCTEFHCLYDEVSVGPSCFMPKNNFSFHVQNVTKEGNGTTLHLTNITLKTPYGNSLNRVTFKLTYLTENILRFQFKDSENKRYEVPVQEHFPLLQNPPTVNMGNLSYEVTHANESDVFNFVVKRLNGSNIWDTRIGGLLLSDQYLQIASYLPSRNVYGLGEHAHSSLKHDLTFATWPIFARDRPVKEGNGNLYGVHPFYTCLENDGKSHGVLLLNSNAMEVTFMPSPAVSFRTIGGILDFFIFVGDNPEHVIQLYTSLIGRPMMPPYWGLGFQLSRYGYNRIADLKNVLNRNLEAKIPITVQHLDIDHMAQNKDFTFDNVSFVGLPEYVELQKKEHDLKWVIILDPAISADKNYEPYSSGLKQSVFIKRQPSWKSSMFPKDLQENITFGKVWPPGYAAFPDFFLNSTKEWWKSLIEEHRKKISFDALWIDMNEPANFGTNEKSPDYCQDEAEEFQNCWSLMCPKSRYDDPPYNPLFSTSGNRLSEKTLCMDTAQGESSSLSHYDVHSLYGWSQTLPTLEAVQNATNSRSFVITRSTYPSSGAYAGHWLGDNESTFEDLRLSIIGMLEFNLFGIPYVGADVCGFFGNAGPHLCKRWMQLGAFYPFFRNHNGKEQQDQDPASLGDELKEASRKAIERRHSLNPYLYTLFYKAHVYGNTVVRPVFHEFPNDSLTWDLDRQFMWGESLLISPVLVEEQKSISVYLPKDVWWRFKQEKSWLEPYTEQYVILTDADEYTPIHVRGGSIIPFSLYEDSLNDTESRNFTLFVFPKDNRAKGDLFVDDGVSAETVKNQSYSLYNFNFDGCSVKIADEGKGSFAKPLLYVDKIVVFNVTNIKSLLTKNTFTTDEKYRSSTIVVNSEMKTIKAVQWNSTDGRC